MSRGRKPKRRNARLIGRLHGLMALHHWNQGDLASQLGVSASTVTRALASKAVSSDFEIRAAHLIAKVGSPPAPKAKPQERDLSQELHLLRNTYRLLLKLDSKLETLLAEQASGAGGSGKG